MHSKQIVERDSSPLGKRKQKEKSEKKEGKNRDMSKRKKSKEYLEEEFKEGKVELAEGMDPYNPVRVYADGVFDLFHIGHARVLKQAKRLFKYTHLTVGVCGDEDTMKYKGKVVMTEKERAKAVKHCKWADAVICPCPWFCGVKFLKENNLQYIAHDSAPYTTGGVTDCYAPFKEAGMFKETKRTEGISTSDIVLRILKDYDNYVWRNLQRGYTPKEMNISSLHATTMKLKNKVKTTVKKISTKFNKKNSKIKESGKKKKLAHKEEPSSPRTLVGAGFDKSIQKMHDSYDKWRDKYRTSIRKYSMEFASANEQLSAAKEEEEFD